MSDTICIAVKCQENGQPRLVLCSDTRITMEGVARWDGVQKVYAIGREWVGMFAGSTTKAKELVDKYVPYLTTNVHIDHALALEQLRQPLRQQRRSDIEEYVQGQIGMSFQEFLDKKDAFPPAAREDLLAQIRALKPSYELIIAGFIGNAGGATIPGNVVSRLYSMEYSSGSLVEQDAFSAIGCGWSAALSTLSRRNCSGGLDIHEAIYYVYEAKKDSEIIDGVGPDTYMLLLAPVDSRDVCPMRTIGAEGWDILNRQHRKFGRRQFSKKAAGKLLPIEEVNSEWRNRLTTYRGEKEFPQSSNGAPEPQQP